jgi:hypothetical protein
LNIFLSIAHLLGFNREILKRVIHFHEMIHAESVYRAYRYILRRKRKCQVSSSGTPSREAVVKYQGMSEQADA